MGWAESIALNKSIGVSVSRVLKIPEKQFYLAFSNGEKIRKIMYLSTKIFVFVCGEWIVSGS